MKNIPEIKISVSEEQGRLIQKMISEIDKPEIKAVSFRFSGVLVNLPFSEKEDLFLLCEKTFRDVYKGRKSFVDLRITAENKADNLDEIYDLIMKQSKISRTERDMLMNTECSLFADLAFPRNFGKKLFNEAKSKNKKIIVVSDTFYPQKTITDILTKCGYRYDNMTVIVSGKNQSVYNAVIEKSGVSPEELLHIGNDVEEDVEKPVMNGSKALLAADTILSMIKSGRLRGYVQSERLYDYDSADFLSLHCAFGLYASYMFDLPKSRSYKSDFCSDLYMTGFIVFGTLFSAESYQPEGLEKRIADGALKNPDIKRGMDDFLALFNAHTSSIRNQLEYKGMELPFKFYVNHAAENDRNAVREFLGEDTLKEWENNITEPKTAPVYIKDTHRNAVEELADKMFPPGTKVRNIADGILVKMKQKAKL